MPTCPWEQCLHAEKWARDVNHMAKAGVSRNLLWKHDFSMFPSSDFPYQCISSSIAYIKVKSNQLESHNNWPQCLIWNKFSPSPPPFFFIWDSVTTSTSWGRFRRPECNDFTAKPAAGSGERTAWPQWPGFAVGPGGREVSHPQNERSSQIPSDSKMLKLQIKLTRSRVHTFLK